MLWSNICSNPCENCNILLEVISSWIDSMHTAKAKPVVALVRYVSQTLGKRFR